MPTGTSNIDQTLADKRLNLEHCAEAPLPDQTDAWEAFVCDQDVDKCHGQTVVRHMVHPRRDKGTSTHIYGVSIIFLCTIFEIILVLFILGYYFNLSYL